MANPMGTEGMGQRLLLLAAGAAVVVIVTSIPIVGAWVKLAVILFGLGAFAVAWWHAWRSRRAAPPTAPVA